MHTSASTPWLQGTPYQVRCLHNNTQQTCLSCFGMARPHDLSDPSTGNSAVEALAVHRGLTRCKYADLCQHCKHWDTFWNVSIIQVDTASHCVHRERVGITGGNSLLLILLPVLGHILCQGVIRIWCTQECLYAAQ